MNRRQFILGSAAGLVLPSFFDKVFSYVENHGEPLLITPKHVTGELHACSEMAVGGGFELNIGDPWQEPPEMTIREFAQYQSHLHGNDDWRAWYCENWGWDEEDEPVNWDAPMGYESVVDGWCRSESPNALAYYYLEELDLGPQLAGAKAVGELQFIDGPCPGNDYLGVHAADEVTLSLLQNRLNELGEGLKIIVS